VIGQHGRTQREKAVDLRVAVPVLRLQADMYTVLDNLVLRHLLEEQPRSIAWFDDDLRITGNTLRMYGMAEH